MIYHILNGDMLAGQIRETSIQGSSIVCAESMVEGDTSGDTLEEFWHNRANFIAGSGYSTVDGYYKKAVSEFERIIHLPEDAEVHLWFENDLFCQVNMWFVLSLLSRGKSNKKIYRIFPVMENNKDKWKGFGMSSTEMLEQAYNARVKFREKDIQVAKALWKAFKGSDFDSLMELSNTGSSCFQYLPEVCRAQAERFPKGGAVGRPQRTLMKIIENGALDFDSIFAEFSKKEGVYGFGDLQVLSIFNQLKNR